MRWVWEYLIWGSCAGSIIYMLRIAWYAKQRSRWYELVHKYNMAMIEWFRAGNGDIFELPAVLMHGFLSYEAMGEFGFRLLDFRVWTMEGLIKDELKDRYAVVMRWNKEHQFGAPAAQATLQ